MPHCIQPSLTNQTEDACPDKPIVHAKRRKQFNQASKPHHTSMRSNRVTEDSYDYRFGSRRIVLQKTLSPAIDSVRFPFWESVPHPFVAPSVNPASGEIASMMTNRFREIKDKHCLDVACNADSPAQQASPYRGLGFASRGQSCNIWD